MNDEERQAIIEKNETNYYNSILQDKIFFPFVNLIK